MVKTEKQVAQYKFKVVSKIDFIQICNKYIVSQLSQVNRN